MLRSWNEGHVLSDLYRVTHLLANLGWVDLDLGSSPGWWPPLGHCSYILPKQDVGTSQIKVNTTQVRQEMCHPAQSFCALAVDKKVIPRFDFNPVWVRMIALM